MGWSSRLKTCPSTLTFGYISFSLWIYFSPLEIFLTFGYIRHLACTFVVAQITVNMQADKHAWKEVSPNLAQRPLVGVEKLLNYAEYYQNGNVSATTDGSSRYACHLSL